MSQLVITHAGLGYKDAVFSGEEVQNISHFVFALVPDLSVSDPIDPTMEIPQEFVVHTQQIEAVTKMDGNAVVLSAVLGYEVGDFDYNWFGAVATKKDGTEVLVAVVQTAQQSKTRSQGASVGNYSVKSIVWRSIGIAEQLNVLVNALPWQVQEGAFVSSDEFAQHKHDGLYAAKNDVLTPVPLNAHFDANTWRPVTDSLSSDRSDWSASALAVKVTYNAAISAQQTANSKIDKQGARATVANDGITQLNINSKHYITENDGGGNFNIRIGHRYDSSQGGSVPTELGNHTAFHENFTNDASNGSYSMLISNTITTDGVINSWVKAFEVSRNTFDIFNGLFQVDALNNVVKVKNVELKPAAKEYFTAGDVIVDFSKAVRHIITRFGSSNGTISLQGTPSAGDELIVENIRDDSGVATITGKVMYTGRGGESAQTHTLTGRAKVYMTCYDGTSLMISEVQKWS